MKEKKMATHGHFVLIELKNGVKTVDKVWKKCWRIVEVVHKFLSCPDGKQFANI